MKRIIWGSCIVAALLALALLAGSEMERLHAPVALQLQTAAGEAAQGQWQEARAKAEAAAALWEDNRRFVAILADHSPMDDIDGLFAELLEYGRQEEMPHFCALCRHLARLVEGMAENHHLTWWNLL